MNIVSIGIHGKGEGALGDEVMKFKNFVGKFRWFGDLNISSDLKGKHRVYESIFQICSRRR